MSTIKEAVRLEREEAIARLTDLLRAGDTVHTILRKVSKSGMTREISLVIARDNKLIDITYDASHALGNKLVDGYNRAIRVNGCGMDMGWHLVYNLSSVLFRGMDRDGYALKQSWI